MLIPPNGVRNYISQQNRQCKLEKSQKSNICNDMSQIEYEAWLRYHDKWSGKEEKVEGF